MNGELTKRRKTMNGEEELMTFMKLPNDLILNILARVSRIYYPTLSLVSKRFRSLLSSPELYQIRTFLGCTEICLYVCLKSPTCNKPVRWFVLCTKPNSCKKVLVPITSPNSTYNSDIVSVGSNIYSIGGSICRDDQAGSNIYSIGGSISRDDQPSSRVMVMDCYSNTWREAPNMRIAREFSFPSICVFDGKIYVTGGCKNLDASNLMEVFDTKTQTWEFKLSGNNEKVYKGENSYKNIVYEGTVHVLCLKTNVVHKLHEGSWIREEDLTVMSQRLRRRSSSACVIENVLYTCTIRGTICWYDSEVKKWKALNGLGRTFGFYAKLADSGGKLAICWEEVVRVNGKGVHSRKIWCGKIAIVKRQVGEIWGRLECSDIVLTPHKSCIIDRLLAVTL